MRRILTSFLMAAALSIILISGGCKYADTNGAAAAPHSGTSVVVEDIVWLRQMNSGNASDWKDATLRIEAAGRRALEFLVNALQFDDGGEQSSRIREYAARRLGQLKAVVATVELCAALRDRDVFVRSASSSALIGINDITAVPLILEMLESEPRPGPDIEMEMFEVLKSMTGTFDGYEYKAGDEKRGEVIKKCRTWWLGKSREMEN